MLFLVLAFVGTIAVRRCRSARVRQWFSEWWDVDLYTFAACTVQGTERLVRDTSRWLPSLAIDVTTYARYSDPNSVVAVLPDPPRCPVGSVGSSDLHS